MNPVRSIVSQQILISEKVQDGSLCKGYTICGVLLHKSHQDKQPTQTHNNKLKLGFHVKAIQELVKFHYASHNSANKRWKTNSLIEVS